MRSSSDGRESVGDFKWGDRVIVRGTVGPGWPGGYDVTLDLTARAHYVPSGALEPEPYAPKVGDEVVQNNRERDELGVVTSAGPYVYVKWPWNRESVAFAVRNLSPAPPITDVDTELLAAAEDFAFYNHEGSWGIFHKRQDRLRAAVEAVKAGRGQV
jgi:hypothetical protein